MDRTSFVLLIFSLICYLLVIYCYANTIYIAFTLDSKTNLISAGLYILLVDSAFVIIYFILCLIIEPGEVKESINIRELTEENKYIPSDSIDSKYVTPAKVHFCSPCNSNRPPHAIHCDICKKCILYHHFHNFLFKKCFGYYNLKFFASLQLYTAIGLIIVFSLNYEIMRNSKTPYYGIDHVFMFMISICFCIVHLINFLDVIKCASDISYFIEAEQDVFGSALWYETIQIFFGKNSWAWFLPIKVPRIESLAIDLRLNTHYGGIIKVKDKFII